MSYQTLISCSDLLTHLDDPGWAIVDCRFTLAEPSKGRRDYLQAHIQGAVYAHLDEDLSGPVNKGITGRHPLPQVEDLTRKLSGWGIGAGVQVVAYDEAGGALAAARLWWLLKWLDHYDVAVLDGGWPAWVQAGYPTRSGEESRSPRPFTPHLHPELIAGSREIEEHLGDRAYLLLDVRARERYLGKNETIDPVAGHIPGAISAPYAENLTSQGTFQSAEQLRERYLKLLGGAPANKVIFYCGSGVTAAHGVLAMTQAGLGIPRLYAGSWSEWITDPRRPTEA
jgi:thiosulfate/3-mercaptopyruvate sulfurtransferase